MVFYEPGVNRQIDIHELGVVAFNDSMGHISQSVELKREEGLGESITVAGSLIRGKQVESNSVDNL